jgi:hypothetical protein
MTIPKARCEAEGIGKVCRIISGQTPDCFLNASKEYRIRVVQSLNSGVPIRIHKSLLVPLAALVSHFFWPYCKTVQSLSL